jgi:hypothetical protein
MSRQWHGGKGDDTRRESERGSYGRGYEGIDWSATRDKAETDVSPSLSPSPSDGPVFTTDGRNAMHFDANASFGDPHWGPSYAQPWQAAEDAQPLSLQEVLAQMRTALAICQKTGGRDIAIDYVRTWAEALHSNPILALMRRHAREVESGNEHAYFELACTRQTGWMAWLTDRPLSAPVVNPDRNVIARGQGETPEAACADALGGS